MRYEKVVCLTRRQASIMPLLAVAALLISHRSHSGAASGLRYGLLGLVQHDFCKLFEYTIEYTISRTFNHSHCYCESRRGIAGQAEAENSRLR